MMNTKLQKTRSLTAFILCCLLAYTPLARIAHQ